MSKGRIGTGTEKPAEIVKAETEGRAKELEGIAGLGTEEATLGRGRDRITIEGEAPGLALVAAAEKAPVPAAVKLAGGVSLYRAGILGEIESEIAPPAPGEPQLDAQAVVRNEISWLLTELDPRNRGTGVFAMPDNYYRGLVDQFNRLNALEKAMADGSMTVSSANEAPFRKLLKLHQEGEIEMSDLGRVMRSDGASVESYARISDEALDKAYGYGLSKPGTFGWEANQGSARKALGLLRSGETDVEKISAAIHEGWGEVARTYEDPVYQTKPEKRDNRLKLADTRYEDLPEAEKEKDRVVARALLGTYRAQKLAQDYPWEFQRVTVMLERAEAGDREAFDNLKSDLTDPLYLRDSKKLYTETASEVLEAYALSGKRVASEILVEASDGSHHAAEAIRRLADAKDPVALEWASKRTPEIEAGPQGSWRGAVLTLEGMLMVGTQPLDNGSIRMEGMAVDVASGKRLAFAVNFEGVDRGETERMHRAFMEKTAKNGTLEAAWWLAYHSPWSGKRADFQYGQP